MSIETNSINQNQIQTANNNKVVAFKSKPMPNDKVELSAKKKEISNGAKIGIGISIATVIGLSAELIWSKGKHLKSLWEKIIGKGISGNNSINEDKKYLDKIDEIKENFSKIFGRDYTKDEAQELALKYKEIFETEDNNKFLQKMLKQIRTDYDLPEFKLSLNKKPSSLEYASWNLFKGGIEYNIDLIKFNEEGIVTELNRPNIIMSLAHELKHATQDKIANQVDIHKHITAIIDREQRHNSKAWQIALEEYGNNIEETREKFAKECYEAIIPSFKNLEKIHESSPMYQKGLEYIEGQRNYVTYAEGLDRYRSQLIEKEAFDAGDRMEQIYKWLTNK